MKVIEMMDSLKKCPSLSEIKVVDVDDSTLPIKELRQDKDGDVLITPKKESNNGES